MVFNRNLLAKIFAKVLLYALPVSVFLAPLTSFADSWDFVDYLDMSPFIPIVLDAFLTVANGVYEYFVGNGDGIIYVLVWGFLAISIGIYLVAMYFPKKWTGFLGLEKSGGEIWSGITVENIIDRIFKVAIRALIAVTILLQVKPSYVTDWVVNPFLEVGAFYTSAITDSSNLVEIEKVSCPKSVIRDEWLSERSCSFLVQPVADLSKTNNAVIKRGFQYLADGLAVSLIPVVGAGTSFFNIITGIMLIITFVGCNVFMALLIIQGIFNFGMALILYPFHVLSWVAKDVKDSKNYVDVWPAFVNIVTALKQLLVTMVACAFILMLNIAIVRSLFNWDTTLFNVTSSGVFSTNVSNIAINATNFGEHAMIWLSAILTFFLMLAIFNMTHEQLEQYAPNQTELYNKVLSDTKTSVKKVKGMAESVKNIYKWVKSKK